MRIAIAVIAVAVSIAAGAAAAETAVTASAPATSTAPATATAPANADDALREKLFGNKTGSDAPVPLPASTTTSGETPKLGTVQPVGGGDPKVSTVGEGTILTNRTVRISRDENTGNQIISFDSDGKVMADPPMIALPCEYLAAMEDAQAKSSQPLRFRITGQVTRYKGKNFVLIQTPPLVVKELNSGIGGG